MIERFRRHKAAIVFLAILSCLLSGCASRKAYVETNNPEACDPIGAKTAAWKEPFQLALSGGGYRAVLFHVGALWRLNELGMLPRLERVSSVSGGSIVAGVLAATWNQLDFDENGVGRCFYKKVVTPLLQFTDHTIDSPAIISGLLPFVSAAGQLERSYQRLLFGNLMLSELPSRPAFIFNATNFQTGAVWHFTREYMGDASIGVVLNPEISLAQVITASSAYPPLLAPYELTLNDSEWVPPPVQEGASILQSVPIPKTEVGEFRKKVILIDGGVGDNLGLESLWERRQHIMVSDGGSGLRNISEPSLNWAGQTLRIIDMIHDQPSKLRTKILIDAFKQRKRCENAVECKHPDGVYWGIQGPAAWHKDVSAPDVPIEHIRSLAEIGTRLKSLDECTKRRLINWGYLAVDRSLPYLNGLWSFENGEWRWHYTSLKLPFPAADLAETVGKECLKPH